MDLRELKALELAAKTRIAFRDGAWHVPSQSSPATAYRVALGPTPCCACQDFLLTGKDCKHLLAARIVAARDGQGTCPDLVTDAVPNRPT